MDLDRDRLAPLFGLLGWTWLGADFRLWLRIGELALQIFYRLGGLLQGWRTIAELRSEPIFSASAC